MIVVEKAKKSVVKDIKDKDSGFRKGDFVVYPTHGVGKILGVETQEVSGHSLQLIIIHFEKDRMTLRVPVAKAKNSGLRKLSSRKVMDAALQTLKGRSRVKRAMWSRRAQEYEAKINSGDPVSIAEVVRDLHRNADQPDQSYSERQIYQAALDRLVRELAAVEAIDETAATRQPCDTELSGSFAIRTFFTGTGNFTFCISSRKTSMKPRIIDVPPAQTISIGSEKFGRSLPSIRRLRMLLIV